MVDPHRAWPPWSASSSWPRRWRARPPLEADDYPVLGALGATRRQLFTLTMARTLAFALAGAAGGVLLAALLSFFVPVGEAKLADPAPGFDFDALLLIGGAAVAVVAVLALGVWPAVRASRLVSPRDDDPVVRSSRVVAFLTASGAPPSALIGIRNALERGRGRTAVPVSSALVGAVLAVAVLCGTAVFGASLTHLTSTPAQYGQDFDAWFSVNGTGSVAQNDRLLDDLERPGVAAITAGVGGDVSINGHVVDALAGQSLRGPYLITIIDGRPADSRRRGRAGREDHAPGGRPRRLDGARRTVGIVVGRWGDQGPQLPGGGDHRAAARLQRRGPGDRRGLHPRRPGGTGLSERRRKPRLLSPRCSSPSPAPSSFAPHRGRRVRRPWPPSAGTTRRK